MSLQTSLKQKRLKMKQQLATQLSTLSKNVAKYHTGNSKQIMIHLYILDSLCDRMTAVNFWWLLVHDDKLRSEIHKKQFQIAHNIHHKIFSHKQLNNNDTSFKYLKNLKPLVTSTQLQTAVARFKSNDVLKEYYARKKKTNNYMKIKVNSSRYSTTLNISNMSEFENIIKYNLDFLTK